MTNFEKLRSMSDKEFGEWLCDHMSCNYGNGFCPARMECKTIRKGMIKWLKQEVADQCQNTQ